MSEQMILDIGRDIIFTLLKITLPIMVIALGSGLVISLFQALTQIQEATLSFIPKIVLVFVSLSFLLPYMVETLLDFSRQQYELIASF